MKPVTEFINELPNKTTKYVVEKLTKNNYYIKILPLTEIPSINDSDYQFLTLVGNTQWQWAFTSDNVETSTRPLHEVVMQIIDRKIRGDELISILTQLGYTIVQLPHNKSLDHTNIKKLKNFSFFLLNGLTYKLKANTVVFDGKSPDGLPLVKKPVLHYIKEHPTYLNELYEMMYTTIDNGSLIHMKYSLPKYKLRQIKQVLDDGGYFTYQTEKRIPRLTLLNPNLDDCDEVFANPYFYAFTHEEDFLQFKLINGII